jgi:hypothetical protein
MSYICFIVFVARYLNEFCIVMSRCRIAFSVSIINVLMNCLGGFPIAY